MWSDVMGQGKWLSMSLWDWDRLWPLTDAFQWVSHISRSLPACEVDSKDELPLSVTDLVRARNACLQRACFYAIPNHGLTTGDVISGHE